MGCVRYGPSNAVARRRLGRTFSRRAELITMARVSGMLNYGAPVGHVARLTGRYNTIIILSTSRDIPRVPISIRSLSMSFLTFSNRGLVTPFKVNMLCNGRDLLRGVPPFLANNRVVSSIAESGIVCSSLPRGFRTKAMGTTNT